MDVKEPEQLPEVYRRSVILGVGFIVMILLYVLLTQFVIVSALEREPAAMEGESLRVMRLVFLALGLLLAFLIPVIRGRFLGAGLKPGAPGGMGPVQRLHVAHLLSFALAEAVAILGLVLFFIGHNAMDLYGFVAAGLLLCAFYFPRLQAWQQYLRAVEERHP